MPQEDESVALYSIATLPDGTTMSLADYLLGKKPGDIDTMKKNDHTFTGEEAGKVNTILPGTTKSVKMKDLVLPDSDPKQKDLDDLALQQMHEDSTRTGPKPE